MGKSPAFQFYPEDWLSNIKLQLCSITAHGLLINLMCYMHQSERYGFLLINGSRPDHKTIMNLLRMHHKTFMHSLSELLSCGVLKEDENGVLYCKRMVEDNEKREQRCISGAKGGSPKLGVNYNKPGFVYMIKDRNGLIKVGISVNPEKRLYRIKKQLNVKLELIDKQWVEDMGEIESYLHTKLSDYQNYGEWYELPDELCTLSVLLKGKTKVTPTPSSSSSSSTSSKEKNTLSSIPKESARPKSKPEPKKHYGEYVLMTPAQHQKLIDDYGESTVQEYIDRMNEHVGSKGTRYKSHYHTAKVWMRKDGITPREKKPQPQPPKENPSLKAYESLKAKCSTKTLEWFRTKIIDPCADIKPSSRFYIEPLIPVKSTGTEKLLVLAAPDGEHASWVREYYQDIIEEALKEVNTKGYRVEIKDAEKVKAQ